MRSVWSVEPWTGALSLDALTACELLDRLTPDADPDAAERLLSAFETGALEGWAKLKAGKES